MLPLGNRPGLHTSCSSKEEMCLIKVVVVVDVDVVRAIGGRKKEDRSFCLEAIEGGVENSSCRANGSSKEPSRGTNGGSEN